MKINKWTWLTFIILVILGFGYLEGTALLDNDENTHSLTYVVITNLPPMVTYGILFFLLAVIVWAYKHFKKYYGLVKQ